MSLRNHAVEYLKKIGGRLTACFAVIVLLMVLGDLASIWQFQFLRSQYERVAQEDQKQLAVLRVHMDLLSFRENLESLVASQNADQFSRRAAPLGDALREDVERAKQALGASVSDTGQSKLASTLEAVQSVLPPQTGMLAGLAAAGDWNAVRMRFENQVDSLRSLTAAAVEEIDREVAAQRAQALRSIQRLERRLALIMPVAATLTLLASGMLGFVVTRSITRPLAQLDAGARALARGELSHQVPIGGADELANLGRAFNYAAQALDRDIGARKRAEQELKAARDRLIQELNERIRAEREILALSERLINAQEEERMRIARELHDDFSQQITALAITTSILKQRLTSQAPEAHDHIERLQDRLARLAEKVRHLSHQLHPAVLEHAGLAAAVRSYCAEFSSLNGMKVYCRAAGDFDEVSPMTALCIYRVTQEALQNVAKHAHTKEATVQVARSRDFVSLTVSDHGAGCSRDRSGAPGGLGLVSMKERVRLVNGVFQFSSEPDRGTTVKVEIPIAESSNVNRASGSPALPESNVITQKRSNNDVNDSS